jgi:hypothetical protein
MRALITLTPRMYREAIAHSLSQHRPALEVRIAPPEAAEEEVRAFGPDLLVRNDTDGLDPRVLEGVPCRVEVLYSDSMDARICMDGWVEEVGDICTDDLLRVADQAAPGMQKP